MHRDSPVDAIVDHTVEIARIIDSTSPAVVSYATA